MPQRKVTLDILNLMKLGVRVCFLLWSVLLNLWIYFKVVLCSFCNDVLMYIDGGTINLFKNENEKIYIILTHVE